MRAALLFLVVTASAAVLDRIAVTIDNDVITAGDIEEEIRITALENGRPPDFSAESRRQAAERLVDQELIRKDMKQSRFQPPPAGDVQKVLDQLMRDRFGASDAAYRKALDEYGVTDEQVRAHLLWQLTSLRFTNYRFQSRAGNRKDAEADQELEAWLKWVRSQAHVEFRAEAFQ